MKDIAQCTGLGLATISKYLNGGNVLDKNKKAIDKAVEELGYTVNEFGRALKSNRSMTIGVIIPELKGLFVTSIITVVEDFLRHSGYSTIICDCRSNVILEKGAVEFLVQKRVDGIINMPTTNDGSHLNSALEKEIPVVLIDRMIPEKAGQVGAVLVDNFMAGEQATSLLINRGHRNIGVILGPKWAYTAKERLRGVHYAHENFGIDYSERNIIYSDYTLASGHEAMLKLLSSDITAVFTTNYETTLGAIIALNESEISIPKEISVVGFDNMELAKVVSPALTMITQPIEEIGTAIANLLLSSINKDNAASMAVPKVVTLPTSVFEGKSVMNLGG